MRNILIVARHEFLTNVRRTGFILGVSLVPILGIIALVAMAFFGGGAGSFFEKQFAPEAQRVGVVDQVGAFTPIMSGYEQTYTLYPTEEAGRQAVVSNELGSLLVIPADYLSTGKVQVETRESNLTSLDPSQSRSFFVDHLLRNKIDPQLRERVVNPYEPVIVSVGSANQMGEGMASIIVNVLIAYFFGILLVMTIFTSSGYLLRSVAEEKSSRAIEVILSSVTAYELLAGKVLGLGALGLTQVAVWLGSAFALSAATEGVLGVSMPLVARPEIFVLGLVYYVLGFLVFAVLMGSIGALGATMQESQQLSSIFSIMAAVPLMIGGFVINNPNVMIARILSWFPLTSPTMMLLRLPLGQTPTEDLIISLGVLVVTVPVVLFIGARLFRAGLLMYGKRPGLGQIIRVLREA